MRLFKYALFSAVLLLGVAAPAWATKITVSQQTVSNFPVRFGVSASNPPHLRVYANQSFTASTGEYIPAGSPAGGLVAYLDVTCSFSNNTVTVPAFTIDSTRDSPDNPNANYSFYWFVGNSMVGPVDGMQSIQVPAVIATRTSPPCSPTGTCGSWLDLRTFTNGSPPLPSDTYYNKTEIDSKFVAAIASSGAPASAPYVIGSAVSQLPNALNLGALTTGLLKNTVTGGAGTISTAVAGTDYQAPLSASQPLAISSNTLKLGGLTTLGSANQLVGMNSGATAFEYKTLAAGSSGSDFNIANTANTITLNLPTADATHRGLLSSADWTTFNSKQNPLTLPLSAANGGTGFDGSAAANGAIPIGNGSGFTLATLTAGSNITITNNAGSISIAASVTAGTAWNQLTNPTGNLSLAMSADTTTLTYNNATGSGVNLFNLIDTASNTGTGYEFNADTATGSTLKPFRVGATGTDAITVNASGVTTIATAHLTSPLGPTYGGTGLDTHTSSGVASINSGTWTINTLTQNAVLYGAASNTIASVTPVNNAVMISSGSGVPTFVAPGSSITVAGSAINTVQDITTAGTPQFAGLGIGTAAPGAGLNDNGRTLNTDGSGTVGSAFFTANLIKNDSNSRSFPIVYINPTLNTGLLNASTSISVLKVDTTNTSLTGITSLKLLDVNYGGTPEFSVDQSGNVTSAGTVNGVTLTGSGSSLTVGSGKSVTISNSITLTGTDGSSYALPATADTIVGRASTDALTNKMLTSSTDTLGGVSLSLGSDATGDMYYRNSSGVLTRLGVGSTGEVLTVSGGLPVWGSGIGGFVSLTTANTYSGGGLQDFSAMTLKVPTGAGVAPTATGQVGFNTTTSRVGWGTGSATELVVFPDSTDVFTNKQFDTGGSGNLFKIAGTSITATSGNTSTVATVTGSFTNGDCLAVDASGNIKDAGVGACTGSGGTSVAWSSILNPSTNESISMGTNTTAIAFGDQHASTGWTMTFGALTTTPNISQMVVDDTTANTNTGPLLDIHTVGTSTALPVRITAQGTANGISMNSSGIVGAIGTGGINAAALISGTVSTSRLPSGLVFNNQGNTYSGGTGNVQDLTSVALTVPNSAAYAPTTSARFGYDTTANAFVGGVNGSTKTFTVLGNGTTGSGNIVLASGATLTSATLTSPTITGLTLSNPAFSGAATTNLDFGTTNGVVVEIPNAASVGTLVNSLATMTGSGTVVQTSLSQSSGIVGIVVAGAGTTGNAQIVTSGVAACTFDGSVTQNHYVQASGSNTGHCADAGATMPTSGQVIGRVLGNVSGSLYNVYVFPAEIQGVPSTASFLTASSTATLTNKTYDAEGTGNTLTFPVVMYIPGASCNNATAAPNWDLPTTNAPTANCLTGSNQQQGTLDFGDSANQSAYNEFVLPDDWTGNIDVDLYWLVTSGGGSNSVTWDLRTACSAAGATYDTTLNALQSVTTSVGSNNNVTVSTITGVTTTGCSAGNLLHLFVFRDHTDSSTATARLLGLRLKLRRAA